MVRIFGIVNLTRDSFSDGGRFLAPEAAIAAAERLLADGADVVDLGAESTHPDAEDVPADEELRRLLPVVRHLVRAGAEVSIDSCKPTVLRALLDEGIAWWNDVDGCRSPAAIDVVRVATAYRLRFCVMFARNTGPRAGRPEAGTAGLLDEFAAFARERIATFAAAGIGRERLVLDPGMGFFLGRAAAPSLHVLHHLPRLEAEFGPLLVSVSRKSFVGEVTGAPVDGRGAGTLAAELHAARSHVHAIRTHDVRALRHGMAIERAIAGAN
ncbi:MAG: dihydropteroate synthase [Planctomycetes bacterium]|nr:dihydropteroate synthase [Planctomycetota bacterium]